MKSKLHPAPSSLYNNDTTTQFLADTMYAIKSTMPSYSTVLVGLESIAKYVGAGPLSIKRWVKEERFPAKRCTDGIYRADSEAVRIWFSSANKNDST